jgi:TonB-dependent receptor
MASLANAQVQLRGQVIDVATNRPLPSAEVRIVELGRSEVTATSGSFTISNVPPGEYTLRVRYLGYAPLERTVQVSATDGQTQDFALTAIGTTEEIVVTGYRAAQANALQDKRMSAVIKEAITADDAGKLPDQNVAEALRRVTGVTATIDQGEGRYVTVRGIDPSYTNITLDKQAIGSPEGTRRVALDTIPSEVLSRVEVVKAVTPDMDGHAVGGSINIVSPSAFDNPDGRFFSASAEYGYYDLNGKNPSSVSAGWGRTFGAGNRWGILLSGSYSKRDYDSENLQGGAPWEEEGDFFVPDEKVLRDYRLERARRGLVANLEYRPTDRTQLYLRNLFNRFQDTEQRSQTIWDYRNGDLIDQTATSGTFTEGEGERLLKNRREIQSIRTSTLGGEFQLGDTWILEASVTVGEAKQDTPFDNEWSFELSEEMPMTYNTSNFFWDVIAQGDFHNPALYEFNDYERASQVIVEDVFALQFDLERDVTLGNRQGTVKFGAKRVEREKTSDLNAQVFDGFDGDLTLSGFTEPGKSDFYSSERSYEYGPIIDYSALEGFFAGNAGSFEVDDDDSLEQSFVEDFKVVEDVTAAYVMGTLEAGRATVTGGVRVERTESEFSAFDLIYLDGDLEPPAPVRGSKSYTHWLPSLHLRMELRDDLLLRAAWTNTVGRPSYEVNVPFRVFEIDEDEPDIFEGAVETGNPDLEPLESMNFDLALEWYPQAGGILAAGLFFKDIDNPIFTRFTELEDTEFEGRSFSELEIETTDNADSGRIFGLELNYQQQFLGLPQPLNGFGVALNYTYTDSEATIFDRAGKVPFFLQSDHIGNAALFFERSGFEARLAYTYYSTYLDGVGDDPFEDEYIDDRGQLDFKASYDVSNSVGVFFSALNITDEPLRIISGRKSGRLAENEIYSWNVTAGVRVRF